MKFKDTIKTQGINVKGYGTISKYVMQDRRVPTTAKAIYAYFCTFAGAGTSAFPGRDKICYDLQINKSTFNDNLNYLVGYGYIDHHQTFTDKGKFGNCVYEILNNPIEKPNVLKKIQERKLKRQLKNKSSKNKKNITKENNTGIKNPCTENSYTDKSTTDKSTTDKSTTDKSTTDFSDTKNSDSNINRFKINKFKNKHITISTIEKSEDKISSNDVDDNYNLANDNFSKIADIYYKLTSKHVNSKDSDVILEVLDRPLAVPISNKSRLKIIIDTLIRVNNIFKKKNPTGTINSFNYFLKPIIDELEKYQVLKGGTKNDKKEVSQSENEMYIDEYGREYDLSIFTTNK